MDAEQARRSQKRNAIMDAVHSIEFAEPATEASNIWKLALEKSFESVVIYDARGHVAFWNEAASRLYGFSSADAVNGFSLPTALENVTPVFEALREGRWEGSITRLRKDGAAIRVKVRAETFANRPGSPPNMVVEYGVLADEPLTDHATADRIRKLEASEDRYKLLLDNLPVALWQVDASMMKDIFYDLKDGGVSDFTRYLKENPDLVEMACDAVTVTSTNSLATELFGAPGSERLLGPVRYIFEEDREAAANVMVARFEGKGNHTQRLKIRTFDERLLDVFFMVSYPHRSSVVDATILMMVDITDRVRLEQQLRQIEAEFAHASRVSTLGEMVSSIAHEVRQPLTVILTDGETSLRVMDKDPANWPKARQMVSRIVESAERANEIIDMIKEMASKQAPVTVALDVNDVVRQALRLIYNESKSRSIELQCRLSPDLPEIPGDAVQLEQVVVNLLMNAFQAIDGGSVTLRRVIIETSFCDGSIILTVEDSGPGVPPAILDKIFNSFFSTKNSGMGMGLAICRSIVDAHGGSIRAESGNGGGGIFQVAFPVGAGQEHT